MALPARQPTRSSARERRQRILEAALRVIARDGIRAVRHRAVAAEAGVPLAATTYYFEGIDELLSESFRYWTGKMDEQFEDYRASLRRAMDNYQAAASDVGRRAHWAARIYESVVEDVVRQATMRDDRNIELAFKHEALRNDSLRELVLDRDRHFVDITRELLAAAGSSRPDIDAEITLGLISRQEQQALMGGIDRARIRGAIARHLQHLGVGAMAGETGSLEE